MAINPVTGQEEPQISFDVFWLYAQMAGFEDKALLQKVFDAGAEYIGQGADINDLLDLVGTSGKVPEFNEYLSKYNQIKQLNPEITTIADWNRARREYRSLLQSYGLTDIASDASADQFLLNRVSVNEAANRMQTAFNIVNNADEALKRELQTFYPSLKPADIAASILGVGKTVAELEKQINTAGIAAEARTAGLTGILDPQELAKQGVTRGAARQGFQQTAMEAKAFEAAAGRAGVSTTGLTQELAMENVAGLASQRRSRIRRAEENIFSGTSGVGTPSLGAQASGMF